MAFPLYCSIAASVYPGVLIWMLDESRGIQYTKSADPDSTLGKDRAAVAALYEPDVMAAK